MRTLLLVIALSACCWAQDDDIQTSTARPRLPPLAPSPVNPQPFNPMSHVFTIFQGLGQNFQQTFTPSQQPQPLPGYLVPVTNPAANSPISPPVETAPSGSGNFILDLMNRAQMINGTSIVSALRNRVDRIADNNVVIMRLSNILGSGQQSRTRRQTEEAPQDVKPADEPAPAEAPKPVESGPEGSQPSETIDDVVKRVKEQREQGSQPAAFPPLRGSGVVSTAVGTVGQIPSKLFEGLDGLLGVGSISGDGMTGLLDSVTRMIGKNGNVSVAHAESHYGNVRLPEERARNLRERLEKRFEESRLRHDERRREWSERLRERMDRRKNMRERGNDGTVIKPPAAGPAADKPADSTDPLVQPVP